MHFLESKGVRVESVRPMAGKIENSEANPQSYHLHIDGEEKWITLDTTEETLYRHAWEIDPEDMETVFFHLKRMRDRINWLI